jgi:hypothetical protein
VFEGVSFIFFDNNVSLDKAIGAFPEPFKPIMLFAFFDLIIANASPNRPVDCGSHKTNVRAAVIAASIAFPPLLIASSPTFAASGCEVAIIPFDDNISERSGF